MDSVKVSYLEFNETLSPDDETDPEFGRFDAFEVYFAKGDRILVEVKTEHFTPSVLLLAPDDSTYLSNTPTNSRLKDVVVHTEIPLEGDWLLVVRGDTNAVGPYRLRAWWADAYSLTLPANTDFCDAVNFLIAHANADFFFISQNQNILPSVTVPGAIHSRLNENAELVIRFYQGNDRQFAKQTYSRLVGQLKFCNANTWQEIFRDWEEVDILNRTKLMVYELREKDRPDYRSTIIQQWDYSGNPTARHKYVVEMVIRRFEP
jgi:hypothetical protein